MSLQALQLDDLSWTEMVDAIRARIVANSNGDWTMHGPLDPGITLLELFAYLFEQRLYWLDQVPEPFVRGLLALLDDTSLTTATAKTLLAFRSPEKALLQQVNAGEVFHPRNKELPLLTTLEPAAILPVNYISEVQPKIDLFVSGKNHSVDLRAGRLVAMLPADGSAAELQLILWLDRELIEEENGASFNLFFDLDTATAIQPEWATLPNDIQWFDRTTPAGHSRRRIDTDNLISSSCRLPGAQIDSRTEDTTPTPSSEPAFWINDFISSSWNYHHLLTEVPAILKWHYSTGANTRKEFSDGQLIDATGGLRRSGLVRINIPEDWQAIEAPMGGQVAYSIWVTCEACTYSAPPRLRRIIPNAVIASHVVSVEMNWNEIKERNEKMASWLRLPGQELKLADDKPEPLERSVRLRFREPDDWHHWHPTDHFYHHGPEDRVFVVDRPRKRILFGNGLTGRIPVLDTREEPYAELCYLAGGGSQGNIGELDWVSNTTALPTLNPVPSIGGAEAETLDEAKARVARDLSRRERAVTAEDFEWLAKSTPGVAIARAYAAVGYHPGFPCHPVAGAITVFVVPEVPRESELFESGDAVLAPQTDPGAIAEVTRRIDTRRLVTSEIYVRSAPYRAVCLRVELQGIFASEISLHTDISLALTQYLDPLIGGDNGAGWPFGDPLRPSNLLKQIQMHIDDRIIVKRVAIALDSNTVFEDCRDVDIQEHELVYLQALSLRIDRTPAGQGGLR